MQPRFQRLIEVLANHGRLEDGVVAHLPAGDLAIAGGYETQDIKARFDAKMHPLQYLRPQAAPSEGNIAQAACRA